MKFVFTLFSLLLATWIYASKLDSIRAERRASGLYIIHRVEEEETLYSLARRYESSVQQIISDNKIVDSQIEIGQVLEILSDLEKVDIRQESKIASDSSAIPEGYHLVGQGETLYSISRRYDLKVRDLKKWNELEGNYLSPGMLLKVAEDTGMISRGTEGFIDSIQVANVTDSTLVKDTDDPFEGFESYFVQTGETLYTIANKFGIARDSLKIWNGLKTDYLKIGQKLLFRKSDDLTEVEISNVDKNKIIIDENGFEKVFEEGIASVIGSMETSRFLALHRSLPIGTNLEVRNLMNNQVVHVKVVGKLPDTGMNKNLMLRLSKPAYDQLGILDSKSRVEISYHK